MTKTALPGFLLLILAMALSAQDKRTVGDYFVTCPALTYHQGAPDDELSWIQAHPDALVAPSAQQLRVKQLLLAGVPLDYNTTVRNLVLDPPNGYLHLTVAEDDLTLVYFEKADKTRIVAFRLENTSYQFPTVTWAFFEVVGDRWTRIADQDILPTSGTGTFFPKGKKAADEDALSLTQWDLFLPQFGTTARLIPLPYSTDLEDPKMLIKVPGTTRKVRYGTYVDWFHQNFENPARAIKSLELKWNKAAARFDAGKVVIVPQVPVKPVPGRQAQDVLANPQNVWEDFLADPELVYDAEAGLYWDPNREDHEGWAQKQELLSFEAFGALRLLPSDRIDIDLTANYVNFTLTRQGPDPDSHGAGEAVIEATLQFTSRSFLAADKSRLTGYRFWGHQRVGDADNPRTEYNQIAAHFRRVAKGIFAPLNDEDVFPLDRINAFVLPGATAKDQALQAAAVWDVKFAAMGTTVQLVPWRLKPLSPSERTKLVGLFGSEDAVKRAFGDFVQRYYAQKALALTWNKTSGKFENPVEVAR